MFALESCEAEALLAPMSFADKPKVLIIIGDASETVDTMYPYFRLIEGGYEPVLAAPEKRTYQMVMHQNINIIEITLRDWNFS